MSQEAPLGHANIFDRTTVRLHGLLIYQVTTEFFEA
jgi:hypothetical protein